MKVNFAEVEGGGFAPLPEGRYECVIERVEVRESQSSDNDYLNIELKVTDEEHEGRRLWFIRSFSDKAMPMMKDTLLALDVIEEDDELEFEWDDEVDITPKEGPVLTHPDLEGIACVAVVYSDIYEGRESSKVRSLEAAETSPKKRSASNGKAKSSGTKAKAGGRKRALR